MAVGAELALRPERHRSDTGIADENVEPLVPGEYRFGEPPRSCKRRQIGLIEERLTAPLTAYLIGESSGPLRVAAMDQDFCAGGGEFGGDIAADAIGRTRDQHRLAVHFHLDAPLIKLAHFLAANRIPLCRKML